MMIKEHQADQHEGSEGGTGPCICLALAGLSLLPSQVQSEDGACITLLSADVAC